MYSIRTDCKGQNGTVHQMNHHILVRLLQCDIIKNLPDINKLSSVPETIVTQKNSSEKQMLNTDSSWQTINKKNCKEKKSFIFRIFTFLKIFLEIAEQILKCCKISSERFQNKNLLNYIQLQNQY